jgi:hypothetical protein
VDALALIFILGRKNAKSYIKFKIIEQYRFPKVNFFFVKIKKNSELKYLSNCLKNQTRIRK